MPGMLHYETYGQAVLFIRTGVQILDEDILALQISQQSAGKLETLIEDLIMVSLATRGELSVKLENMDIRRIANLAVKSYATKALDREINLQAVIDEDVPFVQADSQISVVVDGLDDRRHQQTITR